MVRSGARWKSLLAAAGDSGAFIEDPVLERHAAILADELGDPYVGRMVGPYRIEAVIGQGGMGTVYRAARADGHFEQKVAIKIVKRGMDNSHILRRFRHERQILASLDHPNIARLLDGGSTDDGLPYFVMEFIQGQPVHEYCEARRLSVDERLAMFRPVCAAVHHAHTRRVVHRDIKPGNILITAGGVPKLLDFGIAKLMHPESVTPTDAPTITAMLILTPEYASPEQILGDTVTASSDIYSLGVLLFELVTGKRPYDLEGRSIAEIVRILSEQEPRRPSTITDAGRDLDVIVLKAMRREPAARYATAEALSDDIERYLARRPVLARRGMLRALPDETLRAQARGAHRHHAACLSRAGAGAGRPAAAIHCRLDAPPAPPSPAALRWP